MLISVVTCSANYSGPNEVEHGSPEFIESLHYRPGLTIPQWEANHCQTLNEAILQSRYIHLAMSISIPHLIIFLQVS